MSEPLAPQHGPQPDEIAQEPPATPAARLARWQDAGGVLVPVATGIFAFLIGGVVIAATGHNPIQAYWDIIKGAGFNWLAHPWNTDVATTAAYNFSQTLLQTTSLILCGLAVAFAFRCGLFNIGGQGQYLVGVITGVWIGTQFPGMNHVLHILLAVVVAGSLGLRGAGDPMDLLR